MKQTPESQPLKATEAIELWKYFGNVGASDKNTMVTAGSWLLGGSAALIWYLVTVELELEAQPIKVVHPLRALILSIVGMAVSLLAGYVALLYAGYSNWNWAHADVIAREQVKRNGSRSWQELIPKDAAKTMEDWRADLAEPKGCPPRPTLFAAWAIRLGRPCEPTTELAPVFSVYAWLAALAALSHTAVGIFSLFKL
jgi:hypothetical protein